MSDGLERRISDKVQEIVSATESMAAFVEITENALAETLKHFKLSVDIQMAASEPLEQEFLRYRVKNENEGKRELRALAIATISGVLRLYGSAKTEVTEYFERELDSRLKKVA